MTAPNITTAQTKYIHIKNIGIIANAPYNVWYVALANTATPKTFLNIENNIMAITAPQNAFRNLTFLLGTNTYINIKTNIVIKDGSRALIIKLVLSASSDKPESAKK